MRLVKFNKSTWAIGFEWSPSPVSLDRDSVLGNAGPGHSVVVVRGAQCGYGDGVINNLKNKNIRSLAACLNIPEDTFLGIFRFIDIHGHDVYWLFSRINGHNIGFGDSEYENVEAARKAANELQSLMEGRFDGVEEYLTVEEAEEYLKPFCKLSIIDKVARNTGAMVSLERYHSSDRVLKLRLFLLMLILLILAGGCYEIWSYMDENAMTERSRNALMEKKREREEFLKYPERQFEMVWKKQPVAHQVVDMCIKELKTLPLMREGWALGTADCSSTGLSVSWSEKPYSRYDAFPDDKTRYGSGRSRGLSSSYPVPGVQLRDGEREDYKVLSNLQMVERRFNQFSKDLRVVTNLRFKPQQTKSLDKETTVKCPWQEGNFTVSKIPHMFLKPVEMFFTTMNGVVVDKVQFAKNGFVITGRVYVLPK